MWNVAFAELRKLRRPTLFFGTMGAVVFFPITLVNNALAMEEEGVCFPTRH